MKVCVDAGHGGKDPGAIGFDPFYVEEKTVDLAIALQLEAALETIGHWTVMTRRRDRTLALSSRANFANRLGADLFVSVHANAALSPEVEGMEVFYFPGSAAGRRAASEVLGHMQTAFPDHRSRGVKAANLAVLRLTGMPAILVETEFLTHPDQLLFLTDPVLQADMAAAIAAGIDRLSKSAL
jgi:N-acetylmuramoyl-L-alanine amidase